MVGYGSGPGEFRNAADGSLLATLSGEVGWYDPTVQSAEDTSWHWSTGATYLTVKYADDRSQVWEGGDRPRLLAELGLSVFETSFDATSPRLIVLYSDGRAYLLDVRWLRAMGGNPAALSPEELTRLACEGPLASGLLDEAALAPYMEGRGPQACR